MNTFFSIDAATAWHVIGFAVDLGIKATIALLAVLAVTWGARRRSAALRHRVWFLTYCGLLLLPVLPLAMPKWQIPLPSAFDRFRPEVSETVPTIPQETPSLEPAHQDHPGWQLDPTSSTSSRTDDLPWSADAGNTRRVEQGQPSATSSGSSPSATTSPSVRTPMPVVAVPPPTRLQARSVGLSVAGLIVVWLVGVAVSFVSVFAGRHRGRQLLNSAEPVRDLRWLELLEELRKNLRVTSRVRLLESAHAAVPMATGVVHQAVVLPRETEAWPASLRRHVLIHELAHVKRRDVLQHLICRLTVALYWFHPLAWYGVRRMRLEREIACDDCVLMAGEHPCDYAAELVGIARQLRGNATPWAVCMASGSTLEERVRSMLDRARSHGPLSVAAGRSLLIVALAAISLLAAVEPGTSSVRQQTPTQTDVAGVRASDRHRSVKDASQIVNSPVGNQIVAEANEKPSPKTESKDSTSTLAGTAVDQKGRPVADAKSSDKARLRLAGKVLKPNGDPAIGATVVLEGFLSQFAGGEAKWTLVAKFSADARGAFDRDFDGRWRPGDSGGVRLSAIMPGYGRSITVHPWTNELRSIVLRLAEDAPLRARVLNLEGRPIAGVRVEAVQVCPSKKEWIDRWLAEIPPHAIFSGIGGSTDEKGTQLKAVGQTAPYFPAVSMELDPVAELPSSVTDAEGKVEISGLGRERLVLLKIIGPGIAAAKLYALTHPTKPIEFNFDFRPNPKRVFSIYGSEFDYIAAPGIVVTGVVRDDETKKPIAGAIVASDSLEGQRTSSGGNLSATTDAEGRYRLEGLSRNCRLTITVTRPDSAYLESDLEVRSSRPFEPVRQDILLKRGLWAVGRAYNIKTGHPVAATLYYTPFRSNEFARKSRRSGTMGFLDDAPAGHTSDEGRFRIPILAGRGVIALRCASGDYVPAFGASKSRELSDRKTDIPTFDTLVPKWFDAVAEVDIKPDAAELRIDMPVDPGQDVVFKFVDHAGHRLSGVRVEGLIPRRAGLTRTDTITIPATSPDETRIGWIKHKELDQTQHQEGGLCKFLHFKPTPGERERTITLEPPAVLTGRLVSPAGEPLRDVLIDCSYETGYNSIGQFPEARTDAQGRFRYEIPGGGPFQVASRSGSFFSLARDLTVQSGEQVDFGEVVVSTSDRIRSSVTPKNPPKRSLSPPADPQMGNRPRP
jgi:beta-lactamase regulating signal transducer with metallopeptidase domain